MKHKTADRFFDNIDYVSIIDTVKGIYTSDGSMNTILDFERVLDDADLYAFRNWELGELVQGPIVKRYVVQCTFMWPYRLMPDPRGIKRLISIGCEVQFAKSEVKVPIVINNYDDYVPGTRYPKMKKKEVWFVSITIPKELMDEIKEGSIDLAEQTIDLDDLEDSYDNDLDKDDNTEENQAPAAQPMGQNLGQQPTPMV